MCSMGLSMPGVSEKDAAFLLDYIRETSGVECSIAPKARRNAVFLSVEQNPEANPEGYEIAVDKFGIHISGNSADGLFHGIQTIRKSLPVGKFEEVAFPYAKISDEPRFPYRAMHLDVSRHFFDKDFVKKYIDLLALHNMSYFHWHLTDDQGWRIEIRKYPLLAEKSCRRDNTVIRREYDKNDGTPYGEGCYFSQDDVREIVQYALDRHIRIIPEIDMPGHATAACRAYPELSGSSAEMNGVITALMSVATAVFVYAASRMRTADSLSVVRGAGIFLGVSVPIVLVHPAGMIFVGAAFGVITAAILNYLAETKKPQGVMNGMFNMTQYAGMAALPFAAGLLVLPIGYVAVFLIVAVLNAAVGLLVVRCPCYVHHIQ